MKCVTGLFIRTSEMSILGNKFEEEKLDLRKWYVIDIIITYLI